METTKGQKLYEIVSKSQGSTRPWATIRPHVRKQWEQAATEYETVAFGPVPVDPGKQRPAAKAKSEPEAQGRTERPTDEDIAEYVENLSAIPEHERAALVELHSLKVGDPLNRAFVRRVKAAFRSLSAVSKT